MEKHWITPDQRYVVKCRRVGVRRRLPGIDFVYSALEIYAMSAYRQPGSISKTRDEVTNSISSTRRSPQPYIPDGSRKDQAAPHIKIWAETFSISIRSQIAMHLHSRSRSDHLIGWAKAG